ncbi:MAG: GyrI-like domain-containing protein [archaeon]
MEYRLDKKEEFKVVGISASTSVKKSREEIPLIWREFLSRCKEIKKCVGDMKNYGIAIETDKTLGKFKYVACCEVNEFEDVPGGMIMEIVSESKYVVFKHLGKLEGLGKTYEDVMNFVKNEKMKKKGYWFEFYDHRYLGDKPESEFEIWIAIE